MVRISPPLTIAVSSFWFVMAWIPFLHQVRAGCLDKWESWGFGRTEKGLEA